MIAALRIFLLLWLPGLIVLLGGLPALLRTGQVDPMHWAWPALILGISGWLAARQGAARAVWSGVGAAMAVLLLIGVAAGRPPAPTAFGWFALVIVLATGGGIVLARHWMGLVFWGAAAATCWLAGGGFPIRPSASRPVLHVVTGLPLFWQEGATGLASRADAPIVTILRHYFEVRPIDSLPPTGSAVRLRLLLAQPRAMSPQDMAALDRGIREGGRAVILADPMLRWPSALPLGDRRRAPSVSLLDPLFDHWGVQLLPPAGGERRHFLNDGRVLTVYEASGFVSKGLACRIEEEGLIARCRIGKGSATLIADADLIDDRLWLADPQSPVEERRWTADTPQLLVQALGGDLDSDRRWVRSGPILVNAVRWSVILGFFWAALGVVVFQRVGRGGLPEKGRRVAEETG